MRKTFWIHKRNWKRLKAINNLLKQNKEINHEFEQDAFLNCMEQYLSDINYTVTKISNGGYTNSGDISSVSSKTKQRLARLCKLIVILERTFGFDNVIGRDTIVKIDINEFKVSKATAYNDIIELIAQRKLIEAPQSQAELYNQQHRKKGQRELEVFVLKGESQVTQTKSERTDVMNDPEVMGLLNATPIIPKQKAEMMK